MSKPLKVLLVEDSEDDAALLMRALRKGGFDPKTHRVETAREMAMALSDRTWDVILCDFKLPRFSGLEAIELLKQSQIDIPILLVSGTIGEEMAVECMRRGAHDYILKDNLSRLCPAIERELAEAQSRVKRRQAEKALRENESRLREAQEMARLGFWSWDVRTGEVRWSDQVYKIFQVDPKTFKPQIDAIMALSPWPGDSQRDEDLIRHAVETRKKGSYEQRFLRPDGSVGYYYSTFYGEYDDLGRLISIVGTIQDITERKTAEEALRQSEEKFKTIANYTVNWESWFAPDGKYLWVNPAVERITGYTADEILAMPDFVSVLVAAEDQDLFRKYFQAALAGTRGENYEFRYRHKNGAILWLSVAWQPVYDAQGTFLGIRTSGRDITALKQAEDERRQLEKQLFQAQKMEAIGTLAGGIAHDFNNILSGIIGYAELLQMQADESAQRNIAQILHAAERARNLIKQILAFSRKGEQDKKPMDFRSVIQEALNLLRATTSAKIDIEIHLPGDPVVIHADYTRMHQMIMNIGTNAVHSMGEKGGLLEIRLDCVELARGDLAAKLNLPVGSYAKLSLRDTGCGIDPSHMSRLFDPFFTTKKIGEGTGLGLAVVYGIVQDHGGGIEVESRLGQGSTFHLYLPLVQPVPVAHVAQEAKDIPCGHERILFVDDERDLVEVGVQLLRGLGYDVTGCLGSIQALEVFKENANAFDLVITDMNMPSLSGVEVASAMLKDRPDLPIILCTGYSDYIDREKAVRLGIKEFLMKPVSRRVMALAVRKVLAKA